MRWSDAHIKKPESQVSNTSQILIHNKLYLEIDLILHTSTVSVIVFVFSTLTRTIGTVQPRLLHLTADTAPGQGDIDDEQNQKDAAWWHPQNQSHDLGYTGLPEERDDEQDQTYAARWHAQNYSHDLGYTGLPQERDDEQGQRDAAMWHAQEDYSHSMNWSIIISL